MGIDGLLIELKLAQRHRAGSMSCTGWCRTMSATFPNSSWRRYGSCSPSCNRNWPPKRLCTLVACNNHL
jgi:hypothetical protein